ncbi:carbohydrate kinase family protein [Ornithinimicrobium cryptoxanthini]|uniref:Carbohydrate kinase n=1 Tax=Ornithinimicrobium cryptoxanthini TaxID=2934161 RepID=A0ABY4YLN8_9MICO|nr:carbohydrate kinase [Ornithinimicrobium cryptoxanthini]USQ77067.1 carbohydrate kinase [Ornithinimicrobium cryptoxanthini]
MIGEALIDIVIDPEGGRFEHAGGSPANVALGLSRLGHHVSFLTHVGPDVHGDLLTRHLTSGEVALVEGSTGASRTPTATARVAPDRTVDYEFDLTWDIPAPALTGITHLHTGSIAATFEPGASTVLETVRGARAQLTVSYDPNLRPQIMGDPHGVRSRVEELVGLADVVKASDEDLQWLYAGAPVADIAHLWGQLGPSLVVVTRGPEGALVLLPGSGTAAELTAATAQVVDTVGAGDSFMSGLLSGLLDEGLIGGLVTGPAAAPADPHAGPSPRSRIRATGLDGILPAVQRALDCAHWTIERAGAAAPTRSDLSLGR